MDIGLTDTAVHGVDVIDVRRSAVPRSVEMALRTAQTDASCAAVSVCCDMITVYCSIKDNQCFYKQVAVELGKCKPAPRPPLSILLSSKLHSFFCQCNSLFHDLTLSDL